MFLVQTHPLSELKDSPSTLRRFTTLAVSLATLAWMLALELYLEYDLLFALPI